MIGDPHDPSLVHLMGRLSIVESRVQRAVSGRRTDDPAPDDPLRGLYLSPEAVARIAAEQREAVPADEDEGRGVALVEARAAEAAAAGATIRLVELAARAGLSLLDVDLLLTALAPDLDSRFEQMYGYLNDDVTRRRASVGLALRLCGRGEADAEGRARLGPHGPLITSGLILLEELERPFLSRSLRVPDRVCDHLLGDDRPDPVVRAILDDPGPPVDVPAEALAGMLRSGVRLCYLRERPGASAVSLAVAALAGSGRGALAVAVDRVDDESAPTLAPLLRREALLTGAGLVLGPMSGRSPLVAGLVADPVSPVLLYGTESWDPRWSARPPLHVDVAPLTRAAREQVWVAELGDGADPGLEVTRVIGHLRLNPAQITRAATSAKLRARLAGQPVGVSHLRLGARSVNAPGLERLARRIEPGVGWDDLVLPKNIELQLRDVGIRARLRDQVIDDWRMRPGGGRGRGVTALFAGDSGTGKTMSAEVIANELGMDMYAVNLATVVDKYIGETEKNLEKIFDEAAEVNAVLLFDEADAIFGKRSEVRDAHDRYANIESAYLLQRMESFDGLAVLATNLRSNLDDAFTRRLDAIIDFPVPEADLRLSLWDRCLGTRLPRAADVDLAFCAKQFEMAGGNIRSATLTAAYLAAHFERPVSMADLITAIAHEYRKLGRLCLEREFGPYLSLVE